MARHFDVSPEQLLCALVESLGDQVYILNGTTNKDHTVKYLVALGIIGITPISVTESFETVLRQFAISLQEQQRQGKDAPGTEE